MNLRAMAHTVFAPTQTSTLCTSHTNYWGKDVKSEVELIAEAEAILDETVAYEAARAVHQLKRRLGIDIKQINLEVRPVSDDAGSYHAICTILSVAPKNPLEVKLTIRIPEADGDGQFPP
jgi:hypothetical protein